MIIGFAPGVFDLFHVGHLRFLRAASESCDKLVVGVQDDRIVEKCKGKRPAVPLADRIELIKSLQFVDDVISYRETDQSRVLSLLAANKFYCADDYGHNEQFPDQSKTLEYCHGNDVCVVRIPRTAGISSSDLKDSILAFWKGRDGQTMLGSFGGDSIKQAEQTELELQYIGSRIVDTRSLLDIGCGDGRLAVPLTSVCRAVRGVDVSVNLITKAKYHYQTCVANRLVPEGHTCEFSRQEAIKCVAIPRTHSNVLVSGLLQALTDKDFEFFTRAVPNMVGSRLFVRQAVGLNERVDVVEQLSSELGTKYTAFYRTVGEIVNALQASGYLQLVDARQFYQHRADTAVWGMCFEPRRT